MASINAKHGSIEYEVEGRDTAEPLVLLSGLGAQLVRWSPVLRKSLVDRGFRVFRLDNRDVGLSARYDSAGTPDLAVVAAAVAKGEPPPLPYTLDDMAADVVTLLDALAIERAHVVGRAMGGYIAQLFAARYPGRVRSLTLIMSSTGNPDLPGPTPEMQAMLAVRASGEQDPETMVAQGLAFAQRLSGPVYKIDPDRVRNRILLELDRGYTSGGYARQLAAIMADGDRRQRIQHIRAPTMILHGEADPLVNVAGARELAATIPGSALRTFPHMGHEIPDQLIPHVVKAICDVARIG
jgi:pimeloyl-ACP methyl ester carboxylesterase